MNRALVVLSLAVSSAAHADPFLVAEASGAAPVSSAQSSAFRVGAMPAIGAYMGGDLLAIGVRLRAGILRDGPAPSGNRADPGTGGLGTLGLAMRVQHRGFWIEGVAGTALTGSDLAPVFEAGIGWQLAVGSIDLGPGLRYARIVASSSMDTLGDAGLALFSVDVAWRHHPKPMRVAVAPPPVVAPPPAVRIEADDDDIDDSDDSCLTDGEGCSTPPIVVKNDRIVLDEHVLFDTDHARVKSRGREMIKQIVDMWHQHPEWVHLTIEGHTDLRGGDEYNQELSQRRAEHVRDVLLSLGVDPAQLDAVGYGRTRPVDTGTTEAAHQRNRRVEFVIERRIP
jgi:outer membrane protein OmpA-like peptidoglycan-associated protein